MDLLQVLTAIPSIELAGIIYLIISMAKVDKKMSILEYEINSIKEKINGKQMV